ncbi:DUF2459 domain-containing protein [Cardiobacteriaceae bacterium TAE3-ERU3]|nr:DUF2459 domain-containing protein [Cardiobacteriaceae bacterium TAE3-ERU3]
MFRLIRKLTLLLLAIPALYLFAALIGALLPASFDRHDNTFDAEHPFPVYLVSNGVHANLVLPTASPAMDWSAILGINDPYLYIGWGSRTFYQDVPTWGELTLSKALRAIGFDDSVIAVMPAYAPPFKQQDTRTIYLSAKQLQRLNEDIYAQFLSFEPITPSGTYPLLYPAHGHYQPFLTCNEWMRQRISALGISMPLWSPFDRPLLWYLNEY